MSGGRAWIFGDDIDTDILAPGIYMRSSMAELAKHCLEAADPSFAAAVRPGDVVVGGRNFGIGSSREQAAQALLTLGVSTVLAVSFGGIFYRNALNLGLMALVCPQAGRIRAGQALRVEPEQARAVDPATGETFECEPLPAHLIAMVRAGGLLAHLEQRLKAERK
jgi:3-isopropylmalate/(R)-2-methylmalate dehydratase small subunit